MLIDLNSPNVIKVLVPISSALTLLLIRVSASEKVRPAKVTGPRRGKCKVPVLVM